MGMFDESFGYTANTPKTPYTSRVESVQNPPLNARGFPGTLSTQNPPLNAKGVPGKGFWGNAKSSIGAFIRDEGGALGWPGSMPGAEGPAGFTGATGWPKNMGGSGVGNFPPGMMPAAKPVASVATSAASAATPGAASTGGGWLGKAYRGMTGGGFGRMAENVGTKVAGKSVGGLLGKGLGPQIGMGIGNIAAERMFGQDLDPAHWATGPIEQVGQKLGPLGEFAAGALTTPFRFAENLGALSAYGVGAMAGNQGAKDVWSRAFGGGQASQQAPETAPAAAGTLSGGLQHPMLAAPQGEFDQYKQQQAVQYSPRHIAQMDAQTNAAWTDMLKAQAPKSADTQATLNPGGQLGTALQNRALQATNEQFTPPFSMNGVEQHSPSGAWQNYQNMVARQQHESQQTQALGRAMDYGHLQNEGEQIRGQREVGMAGANAHLVDANAAMMRAQHERNPLRTPELRAAAELSGGWPAGAIHQNARAEQYPWLSQALKNPDLDVAGMRQSVAGHENDPVIRDLILAKIRERRLARPNYDYEETHPSWLQMFGRNDPKYTANQHFLNTFGRP